METSHSYIVEPFDPVAEKLCGDRGLLRHRDIRSAGTGDHYSTMPTRYWLLAQEQAHVRVGTIVKSAQRTFHRAGLGGIEPRHHHVDPGGGHPLPDFHDLWHAFPCAENHLGNV